MSMQRRRVFLTAGCLAVSIGVGLAQSQSDDDVAKRQLESGRSFARQGNYVEALKDFRAVAETHPSSSVADDAWLEIARYYLDTAGDAKEAGVAVDAILKKYSTSDSAPAAYVMAGRLALARSRQSADLETALANFDRVPRLFPSSPEVPRSLLFLGDTLWFAGRRDEALGNLERMTADFPADPASADAFVSAGRALVSLGDPILAMAELQHARDRWPTSAAATTALARLTILDRLYIRPRTGRAAYAYRPEQGGPQKFEKFVGLAVTGTGAAYWATESGTGVLTPADAPRPPGVAKARGLTLDNTGALVVIDGANLRPIGGAAKALFLPQSNGSSKPLDKADAAVQLSSGDWVVMDGDAKMIHRFGPDLKYLGPFSATRVTRLAVNTVDDIAALDRDGKTVTIFDVTGRVRTTVPLKGTGYDLQDPEDLAFDAFGHLYVLDREAVAVFSPYPAAMTGPAPAPGVPPSYRLLTLFTLPDKDPGAFRRATAFGLDESGGIFLYDDRTQRVQVYR
jgi:TolA-binding protein